MIGPMDLVRLIWCAFIELFRSRASLQAEILTLRHQLNVLRRKSPQRLTFGGIDRLVFAGLYRLAPARFFQPDPTAPKKPEAESQQQQTEPAKGKRKTRRVKPAGIRFAPTV